MACTAWHTCFACGHHWTNTSPSNMPCPECGRENHEWMMENSPAYRKDVAAFNKRVAELFREERGKAVA